MIALPNWVLSHHPRALRANIQYSARVRATAGAPHSANGGATLGFVLAALAASINTVNSHLNLLEYIASNQEMESHISLFTGQVSILSL